MKYLKVFTDFVARMEGLSDAEKGRLFEAMLIYADSGEAIKLSGNERFVFSGAKLDIDREREASNKNAENGRKGGRPKKPSESDENRNKPNESQKDKDKEKKIKDNYSVKEKVIKKKNFEPPTLEEVKAYCLERGNDVDPKRFHDYYSAGDWKDGKGNPVKNWKQKLLTWEKQGNQSKSSFLIDSIRRDVDAERRSQGLLIADADALDILQSSAD